ncbi:hypothetical protein AYO44_16205 [Planctomycetaceae bacterium SCGC AG-212-F19]|nr:hypothetical protein AYO44_16205 [Planctomycetaceae bacterium SCGC AG-212-F19]
MRTLAALALLCLSATTALAETFVYVALQGEKKIAVYQFDPAEGKLTHRSDAKIDGEPGALTTDPKQQFLFAAIRSEGNLAAFKIDRTTGKLTLVNTVDAGLDPAHIATDRTGRFLLTAYYVSAKVTVHSIGQDGSLSERPIQSITTADKAHAILPDPSNRFIFVPHTGPNAIFQFTFQADAGKLTPNATPKILTGDNTGPRHIVFHPSKDIAYIDNEQGGSVTVYALDTKAGTLKPIQTVSTLPKDFKGTNACAEIKVHPTGKFLYVSNRGHDSIACFKVDAKDGKLTALGQEPTEKTPRSFDLDPTAKFLLAAGEASGKLAVYRIDGEAGTLKRVQNYEVGKNPWWVMAVELR